MQKEILELHKALKECILTDSQRVAIRNEIGELEDQVALLDFQECEDIDYGYHAQYDFWHKFLVIKGLGEPGCRKSLNISHLHKYLCEHKKSPRGGLAIWVIAISPRPHHIKDKDPRREHY